MICLLLCALTLQTGSAIESEKEVPEYTGIIIVEAVGFESSEGQAVICLFSERLWSMPPDPDNALVSMVENIENLAVYAELDELPPSSYGVLVFHDLDCDSEFDTDDEPWGVYGEMQMMGPPSGSRPSGEAPSGGPPAGSPPGRSGMFLEIDESAGIARIVVKTQEEMEGVEMPPVGGAPPGGGPPSGGGGMPEW